MNSNIPIASIAEKANIKGFCYTISSPRYGVEIEYGNSWLSVSIAGVLVCRIVGAPVVEINRRSEK